MKFHESNLFPDISSNKRLKVQFHDASNSSSVIILMKFLFIFTTRGTTNQLYSLKTRNNYFFKEKHSTRKIFMVFLLTLVIKVSHSNNTIDKTLAVKEEDDMQNTEAVLRNVNQTTYTVSTLKFVNVVRNSKAL